MALIRDVFHNDATNKWAFCEYSDEDQAHFVILGEKEFDDKESAEEWRKGFALDSYEFKGVFAQDIKTNKGTYYEKPEDVPAERIHDLKTQGADNIPKYTQEDYVKIDEIYEDIKNLFSPGMNAIIQDERDFTTIEGLEAVTLAAKLHHFNNSKIKEADIMSFVFEINELLQKGLIEEKVIKGPFLYKIKLMEVINKNEDYKRLHYTGKLSEVPFTDCAIVMYVFSKYNLSYLKTKSPLFKREGEPIE